MSGQANEVRPSESRYLPASVLWLFAASGATSLVYEVLWRRQLMLVVGGASWATAITLSAFMAGLGIGAIAGGYAADRLRNPLRGYGWAEIGIGFYALAFPLIGGALRAVFDAAFPLVETRLALLRGTVLAAAFALLLPPTLLMGATFPLLVRHFTRARRSVERSVRELYLFNTAGAVAGALLSAFVLVQHFGTRRAGLAAALANLLIGGTALWLARRASVEPAASPAQPAGRTQTLRPAPDHGRVVARPEVPPARVPLVLLVFALSGLAALSYETLWTRIMVFVVGNTTQSFAIMLSTFLCGLALGAWLLRFVGEGGAAAKAAVVEGLIALLAVGALFVGQALQTVESRLTPALGGGYAALMAGRCTVAVLLMMPTATLFGLAFPLLVRACVRDPARCGREVGWAYAANTFGAILGPLAAMLIFIPRFGLCGGVLATAAVNVALSLALAGLAATGGWTRRAGWATAGVLAFGALAAVAPGQLRLSRRTDFAAGQTSRLLYYREDRAATVAVFQFAETRSKLLAIDGVGQVPTDADSIQVFHLLGHLPFLVRDDIRDVLVTAFGGGITLGAVLTHPVERVEAVEICPAVLPAARVLREENGGALDDPRLRVILADANSYVRATPRRYDAIVSDATHPGAAESWVLYTREFYQNCQRHLRPGGVMSQWVPLHGLSPYDLRIILRTFQSVFPHATLWFARGYAVLLAADQPLALDTRRIARALADPRVGPSLRAAYLGSTPALLKNLALTENTLAAFSDAVPLATEDRSPLEFLEARAATGSTVARNCAWIAEAATDFAPVAPLTPAEETSLQKTRAARGDYYRACGLISGGRMADAIPLFRRAAAALPGDDDLRMYTAAILENFARTFANDPDWPKRFAEVQALASFFPEEPLLQLGVSQILIAYARRDRALHTLELALGSLKQVADAFPANGAVQAYAAEQFYSFRQYAAAQVFFERLCRLDPNRAAAWSDLAACLLAQDRLEPAREAARRALSLQPNLPQALQVLDRIGAGPKPSASRQAVEDSP